ncbi:unnamed protein product [Nezara viridula]|uniref:Uncharacterized protein n=1 Tax=Nezara viridula TaxID=85310 RepID=A0A9P0HCF5_NEZVI|nr:unnamed protein product [Nezara viridula]
MKDALTSWVSNCNAVWAWSRLHIILWKDGGRWRPPAPGPPRADGEPAVPAHPADGTAAALLHHGQPLRAAAPAVAVHPLRPQLRPLRCYCGAAALRAAGKAAEGSGGPWAGLAGGPGAGAAAALHQPVLLQPRSPSLQPRPLRARRPLLLRHLHRPHPAPSDSYLEKPEVQIGDLLVDLSASRNQGMKEILVLLQEVSHFRVPDKGRKWISTHDSKRISTSRPGERGSKGEEAKQQGKLRNQLETKVLMIARYHRHRIARAIFEVTLSAQVTITHQKNPFVVSSGSGRGRSPTATVLQLVGSVIILYSPYYCIILWQGLGRKPSPGLLAIATSLLACAPTLNGLLYGLKNKLLRRAFRHYWRKKMTKNELEQEIQARTPSRRPSLTPQKVWRPVSTSALGTSPVRVGSLRHSATSTSILAARGKPRITITSDDGPTPPVRIKIGGSSSSVSADSDLTQEEREWRWLAASSSSLPATSAT